MVVTVDVFEMGLGPAYPDGTAKVAVICRLWPAGTIPSAQGNGVMQAPALLTNVNPAGVGSVTVTLVASSVPVLVTLIE